MNTKRLLCVVLALVLCTSLLTGCDLGDKLSGMFGGSTESRSIVLEKTTMLYEVPDLTSTPTMSYPAGTELTYSETQMVDGILWAHIEYGWFVLDENPGQSASGFPATIAPTAMTLAPQTDYFTNRLSTAYTGYATQSASVYDAPGSGNTLYVLDPGSPAVITHLYNDGTEWGYVGDGWVQTDCLLVPTDGRSYLGYAVTYADVYSGANYSCDVIQVLDPGTRLEYSTTLEIANEEWIYTGEGWVSADQVYENGSSDYAQRTDCTVRYSTSVLDGPGSQYSHISTFEVGEQISIYCTIDIYGTQWASTGNGWVNMDAVYEEGTRGNRPCTGTVIDPTPLNVRSGPGTDFSVITQIHYGDYVNILERVTRNGKDWGYTGTGWVYMDLIEIH